MTARRGITLAEMFAKTQDLPPGYDRLAAAKWAEAYGTDVARAVGACADVGVLQALAMELAQVLPALRFEESVRSTIPEYAWALQYMRENPRPADPAFVQATRGLRSRNSRARRAAHRVVTAQLADTDGSRVGRALALPPTSEMLAARIEALRAALDVAVMQHALDARPADETRDEQEERLIAQALSDGEAIRRENDPDRAAMVGAIAGSVMKKLRAKAVERYLGASRRRRRERSA